MTTRLRHVRHAHAGWPAPYTGVIATALFALIVIGYLIWLIARA
jgi:hypothetical protein